jgi:hypothetical protein
MVLLMARYLLRSHRLSFVSILANSVGGGLTRDQIYSYVSMRRREPDGEFVLRFLKLVARLRGIAQSKKLGPEIRAHRDWRVIGAVLSIEERGADQRARVVGKRLSFQVTLPRLQRYQTVSTTLKRLAEKPRRV